MPQIIQRATTEKGTAKAESSSSLVRGHVPRSPPCCQEELAAKAIALLWHRLFKHYRTFSQPHAEPFVAPRPVSLEDLLVMPCPAAGDATSVGNYPAVAVGVRDAEWTSGFSRVNVEELIYHFYLSNEAFDTFSWVIAFCLIDKLQLDYYVRQRIRQITAPQGDGSGKRDSGGSGGVEGDTPHGLAQSEAPHLLRFFADYTFEMLFTAYSLALKSHLDYSVTLNYLVTTLPHHRRVRRSILQGSAALERRMLQQLQYNCFVHEDQVVQLLGQFLNTTERNYILRTVL